MIRIERLTDGIDDEINRLADGPTLTDLINFETILANQFQATQSAVHVITGSLKSSGNVDSSTTENDWEGTISYGGKSSGVHNPVDYAEYEREREGRHDFLTPAIAMEHQYITAINNFFRR